jgi:molybdopterin-guanine dinucleotide biosynthesis protein A
MSVPGHLTGVVLAGGSSRRMGADKAFLEIGGAPMIRRVLDALATCCARVVVVAKDAQAYAALGVPVVIDAVPDQAPLVGLCAGLRAATTPWVFAASCDLPFLSPAAVRLLAAAAEGHDAAVPYVDGRWHPLHAVYAAAAADVLEAQWRGGTRALHRALAALRVRPVGADDLVAADAGRRTLRNVNTPAEYRAACNDAEADKERRPAATNT